MWLLPRMQENVSVQITLRREGLAAGLALEGAFVGVAALVYEQCG